MSQQINLYNADLLKRKSVFSALNLFLVSIACCLILLAAWMTLRSQTANEKRKSELSSAQVASLTDQSAQLKKARAMKLKNPALERELQAIEATILWRHQIAQVLQNSEFGNTDGYSAYLIAFARQIPENLWLTGFSLEGAGYDLVLSGRTLRGELVPQYVSQLKQEKIMQGKSFSTLHLERPLLPVAPGANATDPQKKPEPAPYLEFQLHSSELRDKPPLDGAKQP